MLSPKSDVYFQSALFRFPYQAFAVAVTQKSSAAQAKRQMVDGCKSYFHGCNQNRSHRKPPEHQSQNFSR